jgi:steroid delta-isomerase-like uncharacterized protein
MEDNMTAVQNKKQQIYDLFENVLNKRNWNLLQQFVSEDFKNSTEQKGIDAFIGPIKSFIEAFPDVQWKLQQIVVEADIATLWWSVEGTHTKPFQGFPPSGKKILIEGTGVFEFKDGKIVYAKVLTDRVALLQQINIIPVDISSLNKKENETTINFIDRFFVPASAIQPFEQRMKINRELIKTLPGFINDEVYRQYDKNGNLICITIAKWEGEEALSKAKETVQKEYEKQNFNPAKMFQELGITLDRNTYKKD